MVVLNKLKTSFGICFDTVKSYKVECVLCALGMVMSMCIFKYMDAMSITAWSLEASDALFRGGFGGWGDIMAQNVWKAPHGAAISAYILPFDWLLSLWNLPVLLIHYIFGTDPIVTMPILVWSKLFFNICLIVSGLVCYKIVILITENKNRAMIAAFLLWGSSTMMISIGYAGQNEIPSIASVLFALYFVIKGKKNVALVFMALAAYSSPFLMIFGFIIIISTSDKILEIVLRTCILLFVTAISVVTISSSSQGDNYFEWFFGRSVFRIGNISISLFAVPLAVIVFIQFFIKHHDINIRNKYMLYALSIAFCAMCTFSWLHFYRFMICIPFLILTVMTTDNAEKMKSALFGLCLYEFLKAFIAGLDVNCYSMRYVPDFFKNHLGLDIGCRKSLYEIIALMFPNITNMPNIIGGFAFACSIWVLYVCHPSFKKEVNCRIPLRLSTIIWVSGPAVICLTVLVVMCRTGYMNVNIQHDDILAPAITGQACLEQYYSGKSASKAYVTIRPVTWRKTYPENQQLCIDLTDAENGEVLGSVSCFVNQFVDNQYYQFVFEDIKLKSGKGYIFKIYTPENIEDENNYIYLLRSDDGTSKTNEHYALVKEGGSIEKVPASYDFISEIITV